MADGCANFMGTWCVVSYTLDPNVAEWILDTAASSFQDDEKFDNVVSSIEAKVDALLGRMKVEENVLDAGTLVCV